MTIQRREFISLLGGAAVAMPVVAHAQQLVLPVIGYLDVGPPEGRQSIIAGFSHGLAELGFVEGRSVRIDYRSARGYSDRLPALAAALVREQVAVIFTAGGNTSGRAAQAAATKIPIVFQTGGDPVAVGLVASLNRPGANVTGVTILTNELAGKRLDLMHQLVPAATTIAYIDAPGIAPADSLVATARALGVQVLRLQVASEADWGPIFATAVERDVGAIILGPRPEFITVRKTIFALSVQHKVPIMSYERSFAEEGGLISYGADIPEAARIAGTYVGRILKGEKPADLPVQRSTKFDFVVNLKAAEAIGLTVPPSLLAIADEVIE
jgi:putative ABC transport system substrate-binding protein